MKKIKITPVILAFVLVSAVFTGCTASTEKAGGVPPSVESTPLDAESTPTDAESAGKNAMNIVAVDAKELQEPVYGEQNLTAAAVAGGANDFAFRLSAALAEQNREGNFVCSPYSVWIPLAALAGATDEEHRDELLTTLGVVGVSESDLGNASSRMLYDLTRQSAKPFDNYHNPLRIANAVFVDSKVTLKKEFAQAFMDYYRGVAMNIDFNSKDAVDAVNKWASENTEGLISDIVQEFDPNTVAAIANAIYFSDRWDLEFNPEKTKEDVFFSPSGETKALFMLREGDDQTYYEDDKVQAMTLKFKTGGGMLIVLPKDGNAAGMLSSMTNEYFDKIRNDSERKTGKMLLPRFSIDSGVLPLKDTLTALGVPLFDRETAPLTGGLIEEDLPVWLSDASHKAVIEVDEKGTTAAAVTVMQAMTSSLPLPTEPFQMICDKPFVFVLYGYTYDGGAQVLFTGMVNRP